MGYLNYFDPKRTLLTNLDDYKSDGHDVRDGSVYVFSEPLEEDETVLAVRVALATHRPLLLFGPSGCGKSSLAAYIARSMNWNYFEEVVTSRTQAQDLLWTFDALQRLSDAQAKKPTNQKGIYIEPGVLWWAFDPASARNRGFDGNIPRNVAQAEPPGTLRGLDHPNVILLDEIDKADPDVPNDLLVELGSSHFQVKETKTIVKSKSKFLMIITSNSERNLPGAFLRRCVVHKLKRPDKSKLVRIAKNHFPDGDENDEMYEEVASKVIELQDNYGTREPSTAEYLDAVRACLEFKIRPGRSKLWDVIKSAVFLKDI